MAYKILVTAQGMELDNLLGLRIYVDLSLSINSELQIQGLVLIDCNHSQNRKHVRYIRLDRNVLILLCSSDALRRKIKGHFCFYEDKCVFNEVISL